MRKSNQNLPNLIIAGPGAGKTHQMVELVAEHLPILNPHRFMAVITYTNAATQMITDRLQCKFSLPKNLFVGTIHSFLNRFILIPHGKLVGVIPQNVKFIDDLLILSDHSNLGSIERIRAENAIKSNARRNGFVTYSDIETLSARILTENSTNPYRKLTRKAIATRLEYIFVDEYQDATATQHKVLMELAKENITTICCVGDPEQFIYGFTYAKKHKAAPEFAKLPIMQLAESPQKSPKKLLGNRRSTQKIISFLNRFNTQIQQTIEGDIASRSQNLPIHFFTESTIDTLCKHFDAALASSGFTHNHQQLILARENNIVDQIATSAKCGKISNDLMSAHGILSETLRFMAGIIGRSQREIKENQGLSLVKWRNLGFDFLNRLQTTPAMTLPEAKNLVIELTKVTCTRNTEFEPEMKGSLERISAKILGSVGTNKTCSTIHKAKGLEADAVLVIANSMRELKKWLETDLTTRCADKQDDCRVGFVAFSRARLFLAIGCLEPISEDMRAKLKTMSIVVSSCNAPL